MGAIHLDGLFPGPQALLGLVVVSLRQNQSQDCGLGTGLLAPSMSSPGGPTAFLISPTPTTLMWEVVAFLPAAWSPPSDQWSVI